MPIALLADAAASMFTVSEYRHGCGIRFHLPMVALGVAFSAVSACSLVAWWQVRRTRRSAPHESPEGNQS